MKNNVLYFIFFGVLISIISCSDHKSGDKHLGNNSNNKLTVDAPSELALLMRAMKSQSLSIKQLVEQGDSVNVGILEEWKSIHTAKPTEKDKKTPVYHGFASAFLSSVDSFKLNENNKVAYYNSMITACVDCHQEVCPGPINTIQKLIIKP